MPKTPDGSRAYVPLAGQGSRGALQTLRDYRRSLVDVGRGTTRYGNASHVDSATAESMLSMTSVSWGLVR